FLSFFFGVNPLFAQEPYQAHTHVQLVAEEKAIASGGPFWVGIYFSLDDGWHMYSQNPGDAGLAPKVKWTLPAGLNADDIQWPYPKRLDLGPLTSLGYEHSLLLLVPISFGTDAAALNAVDLHAHINWLACQDVCIPGKADLDLSLPVTAAGSRGFSEFKG